MYILMPTFYILVRRMNLLSITLVISFFIVVRADTEDEPPYTVGKQKSASVCGIGRWARSKWAGAFSMRPCMALRKFNSRPKTETRPKFESLAETEGVADWGRTIVRKPERTKSGPLGLDPNGEASHEGAVYQKLQRTRSQPVPPDYNDPRYQRLLQRLQRHRRLTDRDFQDLYAVLPGTAWTELAPFAVREGQRLLALAEEHQEPYLSHIVRMLAGQDHMHHLHRGGIHNAPSSPQIREVR